MFLLALHPEWVNCRVGTLKCALTSQPCTAFPSLTKRAQSANEEENVEQPSDTSPGRQPLPDAGSAPWLRKHPECEEEPEVQSPELSSDELAAVEEIVEGLGCGERCLPTSSGSTRTQTTNAQQSDARHAHRTFRPDASKHPELSIAEAVDMHVERVVQMRQKQPKLCTAELENIVKLTS